MDTETAALATPFKSKHAEKDRDQKNDESLKGRLFTTFLLGGPPLGSGGRRHFGDLLTGNTVRQFRRRL
jgi:hypothetical protein